MTTLQNLGYESGMPGAPGAAQYWTVTVGASVEEYAAYNGVDFIEAWESFEFWTSDWTKELGATSAAVYASTSLVPLTVEGFEEGWDATPWLSSLGATAAAQYGTALEAFESFALEWNTAGWQLGIGATSTANYDVGSPEPREDFEEEWNTAGWQLAIGSTVAASYDGAVPEAVEDFNEVFPPVVVSVDPGTSTFTAAAHGLTNGTLVRFRTTGQPPGGLSPALDYWVVGAATNTFQVARSVGGPAVAMDHQGGGTHSWLADPTRYWNDLLD